MGAIFIALFLYKRKLIFTIFIHFIVNQKTSVIIKITEVVSGRSDRI